VILRDYQLRAIEDLRAAFRAGAQAEWRDRD